MSFLYPAFLLGALAAAIPIVLHLLRRDVAQEFPFTAVRLLRLSPLRQTRRRRLRDPLLLAARVAVLLLLAAAFARPYVAGSAAGRALHIVAIDRSFSMGAAGRFDEALTRARDVIDAVPHADRVAVVAFDDRAETVAEPGSAVAARAALDGLQPAYGITRYPPLVARALELTGRDVAWLHIVGDLQRGGWEGGGPAFVPAHLRTELHTVALPQANGAVTGLRRVDGGVMAVIEQAGTGPLSGTARLLLDGHPVADAPFTIPAPGSIEVLLDHPLADRGAVAVEIDDPSGFAADNVRHLVLDPPAPMNVVVVVEHGGQSGLYPTKALESSDADRAIEVLSSSPGALGRISEDVWPRTGAVILMSTRGLDRRARDALVAFVRGGGGLLVAAAPGVDASVLASAMEWPDFAAVELPRAAGLAVTDLRHPIFRPFDALTVNFGQARFHRTWDVRADGWDVVAQFSDSAPALLERQEGEGRVLLFASDLDRRWNDFPLHAAFVPFILESVWHVAGRRETRRAYLVGEAPPGTDARPGVFTAADGRRVAIDVDLRESSLDAMAEDEFMAMLPPREGPAVPATAAAVAAEEIEARQDLWRYGILLMLGLLVAESFIGRPA